MFICSSCHASTPKWVGKCPTCGDWNTLEESKLDTKKGKSISGKKIEVGKIQLGTDSILEKMKSSSSELDSVLGGGITPGSLVLLSGEPGIGKSTLALQMSEWYASQGEQVLYVSGEEHIGQISMRAKRLGVASENISLISESNFDDIIATLELHPAEIIIVDSISVLSSDRIDGSPGSISQIRIMTELFMNLAKKTNKSILLIGHVTKDGSISGPKSLEHLVDVVLFLEGVRTENYRILRAFKNRFGSTDNVGLFRMEESGLIDIPNPGLEFIDPENTKLSGSALTFTIEGNRPILVEIESLTTYTKFGYPKRSSRGVSQGKIDLLIAVMSKFTKIKLEDYDVYLNVGRGLSLTEPGVDLACIAAMMSSRSGKSLGRSIFLGEVSLTGVVKNVYFLEKRITEAIKLGFTRIIIPAQYTGNIPSGIEVVKIGKIAELEGLI
ncbi:MAG: DNA repair protein RadA [Candidatus Gracilibacteria bacterium]|nr:DNA repair protein RadA [Candidatus Gracilibacteria bacterium]